MDDTGRTTMESLVEKYGLADVVSMASGIAVAKANECAKDYQTANLAKAWEKAATATARAYGKIIALPYSL